jgi:hypothetical protein
VAALSGHRVIVRGGLTEVAPEEVTGIAGGAWVVTVHA